MSPTVLATVIIVAAVCLVFGIAMGGRVDGDALMAPCSIAAAAIGLLPWIIQVANLTH